MDLGRVLVLLRGASNFDRPYPGQTALESMAATTGGLPLALENVYRAGSVVVRHILQEWQRWEGGVPALAER